MRLSNYCLNISMKTVFMNTGNSKTNEPHKFVLILPQKLHFKARINMLLFKTCLFITRGKI